MDTILNKLRLGSFFEVEKNIFKKEIEVHTTILVYITSTFFDAILITPKDTKHFTLKEFLETNYI